MSKSDFINPNDDAFAAQLVQFKTAIPSYAASHGVTADQMTAQAKDSDAFGQALACQKLAQGHGQQWTKWKNLLRDGGDGNALSIPAAPVFPAAVPAVAPGIETRFRVIAKQIKVHANYIEATGKALGIEGVQSAAPDLSASQPIITVTLNGGQIVVGWTWQGLSQSLECIRLEVDRDGKGFALLAMDTTPGYTDTTPLPATPTKWKYRAIYCLNDAPVGQWSSTVEIVVGG